MNKQSKPVSTHTHKQEGCESLDVTTADRNWHEASCVGSLETFSSRGLLISVRAYRSSQTITSCYTMSSFLHTTLKSGWPFAHCPRGLGFVHLKSATQEISKLPVITWVNWVRLKVNPWSVVKADVSHLQMQNNLFHTASIWSIYRWMIFVENLKSFMKWGISSIPIWLLNGGTSQSNQNHNTWSNWRSLKSPGHSICNGVKRVQHVVLLGLAVAHGLNALVVCPAWRGDQQMQDAGDGAGTT